MSEQTVKVRRNSFHCPVCSTIVQVQPYDTDIEHECNSGNATLDNLDLPILGAYVDDNGNTVPQQNQLQAGMENKLFGTRAWREGADFDAVTARGVRKKTHRTHKVVANHKIERC